MQVAHESAFDLENAPEVGLDKDADGVAAAGVGEPA
jgi:hypothetical protein